MPQIFLGSPHASSAQRSSISLLETSDHSNSTHSTPQMTAVAEIDKKAALSTPESRSPDRPYICVYFCQETSTPCPGARVRFRSSIVVGVLLRAPLACLLHLETHGRVRCSITIVCGLWSLNLGFQRVLKNTTSFLRLYHKTSQEPISSAR